LMNDTWYKVLNVVDEKTSKDTILNSWWISAIGLRLSESAGLFLTDKARISLRLIDGQAILDDDEEEAVAILRMLNNGGNKAFDIIDTYFKDPLQSALLLEKVIVLPAPKAQEELLSVLPVPAVQEVMKLLFYNPVKACFIVDPTMQFKMPAISYFRKLGFFESLYRTEFQIKREGSGFGTPG